MRAKCIRTCNICFCIWHFIWSTYLWIYLSVFLSVHKKPKTQVKGRTWVWRQPSLIFHSVPSPCLSRTRGPWVLAAGPGAEESIQSWNCHLGTGSRATSPDRIWKWQQEETSESSSEYGSKWGVRGGGSDREAGTHQKSDHGVLSGTYSSPALQTGLRRKQIEPEPTGLENSNITIISISVAH